MKDTIYREDAIEILNKRSEELRGIYGDLGGAAKGASKLMEILPSTQQWIPVSEGLPEVDEDVWVTDDAGGMATVHGDSCGRYEDTGEKFWYTSQNVTAWMPMIIPEPYRGNKRIIVKKLKPCPFCGGTVKLQRCDHGEGDVTYAITCFNCYVDMGEYKTVEEIREVWNKRVES